MTRFVARSLCLLAVVFAGCVFPYDIKVADGGGDARGDHVAADGDANFDVACTSGQTACSGTCSDLATSTDHCGRCGNACSQSGGTSMCVDGTCVLQCDATHADCDGDPANGCETDTTSDMNHCGACGRPCVAGMNQTATCMGSVCVRTCAVGFGDCDGDEDDGCETDLTSNLGNCGACHRPCLIANGSGRCQAGACSVASCAGGFADCNSIAADGCETNLNTSASNCGICGHACGTGAPVCNGGSCALSCLSPSMPACGGGCVSLSSDARNCGSCGNACSTLPGSTPVCSGGTCTPRCAPNYAHCSGPVSNGCESDTLTDVNNCGSCGAACSAPTNGIATCRGGNCSYNCRPGFGDCDHTASTGCEIDLHTDAMNCGACGHACAAGQSCLRGSCVCPLGSTSCGGVCANLSTDAMHCGACDHACASGESCVAGTCVASCPAPRQTCGSNCTDVSVDAANCGMCGTVCTGGKICMSGACTCAPGTMDCSGVCTDPSRDPANCGACGTSCDAAGSVCASGMCACPGGMTSCPGLVGFACTDLQNDPANCGMCAHVCPAGTSCRSGSCM